jgi:hypothetical protein
MAQQERAIAHDVIDDLVALEVPLQAPSGMRKVTSVRDKRKGLASP